MNNLAESFDQVENNFDNQLFLQDVIEGLSQSQKILPVSYTHLTLPTKA